MGLFGGHVKVGVYFTVFGLRWTYCVLMRYYLGRREAALGRTNPRIFKNSLMFPLSFTPGIPIEAFILLIASVFQFTGEFVMVMYHNGVMMNGQHMTVQFFFIVASVVCILKSYRVITFPNVDYATMILAFMVYSIIIYYHTLSKSMMETQLHINMVQLSMVIMVAFACEVALPHSVMAACVRCLAVNVSGSLMFQIAFILYYPYYQVPWDQNNTMQLKLAVMMLSWQLAGSLLLMFVVAAFVYCRVSNMTPTQVHRALDITYSETIPSYCCEKSGEQNKYLLDDEGV